jgi:D-alanine-D-alanine ligase
MPSSQIRSHHPVERILYLARFAPLDESEKPSLDETWGNSPYYHHALYHAIKTTNAQVIPSRNPMDILSNRDSCDFVYSIYNRASFRNSEVFVSALCEYAGLPYLGGPPNIRAIAEDKSLAKLVARRAGLQTPDWTCIEPWQTLQNIPFPPFPCIIKWRFGADSAEISADCIVRDETEALEKLRTFQERNIPVIVESFIPGLNLTTAVIGGPECSIFDTIQIDTDAEGNIQTYAQKKFGKGRRQKTIFRNAEICRLIERYIQRLYAAIGWLDYFRCDFRFNPSTTELFFLEFNAVCNLAPESTFFMSCHEQLKDYALTIRTILDVSFRRQSLFLK